MNAPRKFKAPFHPKERIWQEADRWRAAHPAVGPLRIGWGEGGRRPGEVPSCAAKVLDLAEFDLQLDLVPVEPLREAFQNAVQTAQAAGYSDWLAADETALDYIATRIAPKFGVSVEVIAKRLRVEKLWPPN